MTPLHQQFVAEARELVQQASDDLIAAEREGFSDERIDRVFRAFHTLKGSAGVVSLPAMGLILHAAEDLLSAVQAGRLGATSLVIDRLLACLDQVATWVDAFELREALPIGSGEAARKIVDELRSLQGGLPPVIPVTANSAKRKNQERPDWANNLIASLHEKMSVGGHGAGPLYAISYEPLADCFFTGDDPIELMRRVPNLLMFEIDMRDAPPPLADLDPYSCNLRLQGIAATTEAELSTVFRLVPDQVRILEISAESEPTKRPPDEEKTALVRAIIEEQMKILRISTDHENHLGRVGSAIRVACNALRYSQHGDWASKIETAGEAAFSQSNLTPLFAVLDDVLRSVSGPPFIEAGPEDGTVVPPVPRPAGRSLRVDELRIDALIDLAGELFVVKNSFAHLAKDVDGKEDEHDIARRIRIQNDMLERLANELHGAVLQLRMVPLAQVFRSFPRLVRDMSQQLGKEVTFLTHGETTESDKTVVDMLFEPLMHLVRNALDHGIETPDQRVALGKPASAAITVRAARMGDRLVVEVVDDGRGIDPATVRRKADEMGLLPGDELAAFSDEQAVDLIFTAGFSTASLVTEVSGRGVGMDVVRATIERIGGRVSLKSRVGVGTTVILDLPTNIALMRIMVVESGGQVFGIPMDVVTETVRLTPDRISRIKNNDAFVIHDRVVPICSLAELMHLPSGNPGPDEIRLVVVAEINGKTTALEVDAIRDRLEIVLKPMQGLLSNARGYAGTTLLGDGGVLLVLDLKEILQ